MASLKNTDINDTGYIQIPIGTTAQRPTPENGMMRYNTDITAWEYYSVNRWVPVGTAYQYYTEGMSANNYTGNWNNSGTYYMAQYANLGGGYAHGGMTGPVTFTLNLTGLPGHSQARYLVKWHLVDSLDNETSQLFITTSGGETEFLRFTKSAGAVPSISVLATGALAPFVDGQAYSYRPWGNGGSGHDGYISFDSGLFGHTAGNLNVRHELGYNQPITDEAMYLTSVEVWLK